MTAPGPGPGSLTNLRNLTNLTNKEYITMDLSALTELFGNLAGFFGGFKDVFSGLGAIFENGAALSSGSEGAAAGA